MAVTPGTLDRPRALVTWIRSAALALFVNSVVAAYLEVRLYQEGERLIPATAVIMVLAAALAAAIAVTGRRTLIGLGALLMLVALVGASPHSVGNLVNGPTLEKHVFGAVELIAIVAALVVTTTAWWQSRRTGNSHRASIESRS